MPAAPGVRAKTLIKAEIFRCPRCVHRSAGAGGQRSAALLVGEFFVSALNSNLLYKLIVRARRGRKLTAVRPPRFTLPVARQTTFETAWLLTGKPAGLTIVNLATVSMEYNPVGLSCQVFLAA